MRKLLVSAFLLSVVMLWPVHNAQAQTAHFIRLTWGAPVTGGPPTTYNIKRGTTPGSETLYTTVPATTTTYDDPNGVGGIKYYYVYSASNSGGEGPNSSEVSATFLADKPGQVPNPSAVAQ